MSLLSTNIAKNKRLSLGEVKLPATERKVDPALWEDLPLKWEDVPSTWGDIDYTWEEELYTKLAEKNPLIESLCNRLKLVSLSSGVALRRKPKNNPSIAQKNTTLTEVHQDKNRLVKNMALLYLSKETGYTRAEIVDRLREATAIDKKEAEEMFILMHETGVITQAITPEIYYLTGSTPF
jgi:hypothetical protein